MPLALPRGIGLRAEPIRRVVGKNEAEVDAGPAIRRRPLNIVRVRVDQTLTTRRKRILRVCTHPEDDAGWAAEGQVLAHRDSHELALAVEAEGLPTYAGCKPCASFQD